MPILSGIELITRVRAEPPLEHLPVVVITSGGDKEREALHRLGVTLFLHKPVKYPDLADTVRFLMKAQPGQGDLAAPRRRGPAAGRQPEGPDRRAARPGALPPGGRRPAGERRGRGR